MSHSCFHTILLRRIILDEDISDMFFDFEIYLTLRNACFSPSRIPNVRKTLIQTFFPSIFPSYTSCRTHQYWSQAFSIYPLTAEDPHERESRKGSLYPERFQSPCWSLRILEIYLSPYSTHEDILSKRWKAVPLNQSDQFPVQSSVSIYVYQPRVRNTSCRTFITLCCTVDCTMDSSIWSFFTLSCPGGFGIIPRILSRSTSLPYWSTRVSHPEASRGGVSSFMVDVPSFMVEVRSFTVDLTSFTVDVDIMRRDERSKVSLMMMSGPLGCHYASNCASRSVQVYATQA